MMEQIITKVELETRVEEVKSEIWSICNALINDEFLYKNNNSDKFFYLCQIMNKYVNELKCTQNLIDKLNNPI